MRAVILGLSAAMLAGQAGAVSDYDACIDMVAADPARAEREAGEWARYGGGGAAARHCYALALVAAGAPGRAADELIGIAMENAELADAARSDILVQAGRLLLEIDDPVTGTFVAEQALRLTPRSADALAFRGEVRIANGRFGDALGDLGAALAERPDEARYLMLRASVHRRLGDMIAARDDARFATEKAPDMPEAWLERGRVEARMGQKPEARQSLLRAVELDREGEIGRRAQVALQRMEAGVD